MYWLKVVQGGEVGEGGELGRSYEEGEGSVGGQEGGGGGEDLFEAFDGAEGHEVGAREVWLGGEGFGAGGDHIDVGKCKGAGHFAEEGGFPVIGFDEGEVEVGRPDFEREGGESGTGTDIEDFRWRPIDFNVRGELGSRRDEWRRGKKMASEEERFAEVAGHDFLFLADGGEVDAGVPTEQ